MYTPACAERRMGATTGMIDVVYTWVDGDDPAWQARQRAVLEGLGKEGARHHRTGVSASRFKSRDELKYSLRSLQRFGPVFRKLHLVTDDQIPGWIDLHHPDLSLVSHRDIFPDPSHLPTFNSHAIESNLHRIPDLSERFVYFNDDMFVSGPSVPEDYFDGRGRSV